MSLPRQALNRPTPATKAPLRQEHAVTDHFDGLVKDQGGCAIQRGCRLSTSRAALLAWNLKSTALLPTCVAVKTFHLTNSCTAFSALYAYCFASL